MKGLCLSILALSMLALGCSNTSKNKDTAEDTQEDSAEVKSDAKAKIPAGAEILIKAYPDAKLTYKDNKIYFPDGTGIVYDDGKEKSFVEKMEDADIEDMFSVEYDNTDKEPKYLADGGRCRCEAFLKKMYGSTKEEVTSHLTSIDWFGKKLKISTVNGVDKKLRQVAEEIAKYPELKKYMDNSSTFNWRPVRGTKNRLSAHSYGITMDINTSYSNYWLWSNPKKSETDKLVYNNRIPLQIVEIFEKYGFIWGGHWYHYDTMHFEYRPEILMNKEAK